MIKFYYTTLFSNAATIGSFVWFEADYNIQNISLHSTMPRAIMIMALDHAYS